MSTYWPHRSLAPAGANRIDAWARPRLASAGHAGDRSPELGWYAHPRPGLALRELLVPVDGSPRAEQAIPYALAIARQTGAAVRLIHVHVDARPALDRQSLSLTVLDYAGSKQQQRYLAGLRRQTARDGRIDLQAEVVAGRCVMDAIARQSRGVDLVVMAGRGRGALRGLLRPSLLDALQERSTTPIFFVQGSRRPRGLESRPKLRHGLAALDATQLNGGFENAALRPAALASDRLTLFHVATGDDRGRGPERPPFAGCSPLVELEQAAARLRGSEFLSVSTAVAWSDESPARAILRHAAERDADYIALARPHARRLRRALRPGVYGEIVARSPVPLLIM